MPTLRYALFLALALPAAAQSQSWPMEPLRWEKLSVYPGFIGVPKTVAVADDGALTVIGRAGYESGVDFHAGGSAEPLLAHRFDTFSYLVRVDAADHAPFAAAFSLTDIDPDPYWVTFEPRLYGFEAGNSITPTWTWAFPREDSWYWDGGGVRVSDDGEVIVGWYDSFDSSVVRLVALRRDGSLISQFELPMAVSGYRTGGVRLSDDGSRALVPTVKTAMLVDVATGTIISQHVTPTGAPLMGIALSGDGLRYATSAWNELTVFEQLPDNSWNQMFAIDQVNDEQYGPIALNQDGSRLAYTLQYIKPEDRFELVLTDVVKHVELFRKEQVEPETYLALHARDVVMDDAGRLVACASLGDSNHTTPEVFVLDDTGHLLSEFRQVGSALDVDLDPRGEVLAAGISPKYDDLGFVGGNMLQIDPRAPTLRILGQPVLGGSLDVTLAGAPSGGTALLMASPELGSSQTPFGGSALGLGPGARRMGPWPLVAGLAQTTIPVGSDPALAGQLLHFQGIVLAAGGGRLTNKVSLRFVP